MTHFSFSLVELVCGHSVLSDLFCVIITVFALFSVAVTGTFTFVFWSMLVCAMKVIGMAMLLWFEFWQPVEFLHGGVGVGGIDVVVVVGCGVVVVLVGG